MTMASFATAFEFPTTEDSSMDTPTTPKANNPLHTPEYIHIPWDHNTDIAPDLMYLCETIENRTKNGKKVLVHCQQGASRSASLIIAYGLYQSPELSVNDAYYSAQAKSRWISPNMKLMYSLQDFHKDLAKKRGPSSSTYRPRTGRSPTKHRLTLSADAIDMAPKEPHTAPLPGGEGASTGVECDSSLRPRDKSTTSAHGISPGPASAPLTYSWKDSSGGAVPTSSSPAPCQPFQPALPSLQPLPVFPAAQVLAPRFDAPILLRPADLPQRPKTGLDRPAPGSEALNQSSRVIGLRSFESPAALSSFPLRKLQKLSPLDPVDHPTERMVTVSPPCLDEPAVLSPRVEAMTTIPLPDVPEVAGMRFVESSPTPTEGLFSPRESSFPPDPFSFFGRMMGFGRPAQAADPRSPPTRGEAPIIRSIDEIL
jgi:tyrosine-protein phosphatase